MENKSRIDDHLPVMTVDEVFRKAKYGTSQVIILIVTSYMSFSQGYQTLVMYYAGDSPPWTCTSNESLFCLQNMNQTFDNTDKRFQECCKLNRSSWTYTKDSEYSIVTEYDLVCSLEYQQALVNAMFFIGWSVGGLFTGWFADKLGRTIVLCGCYICLVVFPILSCYITAIWQLILLRTLIGVATGTGISILYVYHSELCTPEYRAFATNIQSLFFSVSLLALSGLAFYVPEWRKFELYAAFPAVLSVIITLLLPKSPRWLLSVGKSKQAKDTLLKLAKRNGKIFDFTLKVPPGNVSQNYTYIHLLNSCKVFIFLVVQLFAWFTSGLIYYSLALESSNMGGNLYVNFMLTNVVDMIGVLIGLYVYNKFGRKKCAIITFGFSSVALGIIATIPLSLKNSSVIRLTLALCGKCSICIGFGVLYIWSVELFPTVLRSQGMILCQFVSKIGSAVGPFLTTVLQDVFKQLPFVVMAVLGFLSALVVVTLPETNKKPTRENYEDIFTDQTRVEHDSEEQPLLNE